MSYMGKVRPTIALLTDDIADDQVTSAKIADTTIVNADINASAAIDNSKMATDTTNATNLATGTVPTARLGSGSASSSTFLRGDQTYDTVDTSGIATNATAITANQDDIALLGFKVAANGSLAKYNLVDQAIDAFEDASGVDASGSTNEVRSAAGAYYVGGTAGTVTGGTITTVGADTIHSFAATGSDFVTDVAGTVDYLVLAGGGGGGGATSGSRAGGAGAGGYRFATGFAVAVGTYAVTVGTGGAGGGAGSTGTKGGDSTFSSITSTGGGGGGGCTSGGASAGATGGSGGGGGSRGSAAGGGAGNEGSFSPVEGYNGGSGGSGGYSAGGGGGGGASQVGYDAASSGYSIGGNGGDGLTNDYQTGVDQTYGGGGGGGYDSSASGTAAGGAGGGGNGSASTGSAATDGLGGGGGGAGASSGSGGDGGNGVVVIKYNTSTGFLDQQDLTLASNATTALDGAPDNGDLVMTISNGVGTTTENVDVKAYISRDGSAYSTAVTLVDQGTTGGHTILTANGVDISGITSGTSMKWKVTTHNQSASKETRIHAVSLGWS